MNPRRGAAAGEAFVEAMAASMRALAEQRVEQLRTGNVTLEALEQAVLQSAKQGGTVMVSGLCGVCEARYPVPEVACACGAPARAQRMRTVPTKTVLETIEVRRADSLCPACHRGVAPLDQQLGLCPGGVSAGLEELLALLGVTQDSFEPAVVVLEKLSVVSGWPNSARAATETLGARVVTTEEAQAAAVWAPGPSLPPAPREAPERLSVSIDGAMVTTREAGWKETRLGGCSTTVERPTSKTPAGVSLHAHEISFVADLNPAEPFGCLLWLEAYRRGVTQAHEVVVIGDGADWIWRLAEEHFPGATQIVDWYHASQYLWTAAHAIYPDADLATRWAHRALDALWEGRLATVRANLDKHAARGEPV